MKQTAVEFIFEELENRQNGTPYFTMEQIYNKAKEMENQRQEKLCKSEFLQKLRATLSDAEARRIIRTI